MAILGGMMAVGGHAERQRLNPVIDLIEQKKPVFGLYAPSNRRMPPRPGEVAAAVQLPQKSAAELAKEALAFDRTDFIFDGSMEGDFERGYQSFSEFASAMGQLGMLTTSPAKRLHHPLIVKAPEIQPDPATVGKQIGRQLNLGVSGVMFVSVESAEEVKQGLAAMRFTSRGGTRDETVGNAPKVWGLSEAEYKAKADLWPLNPDGELLNWTIVESKAGLAKVREIAAVEGIGVLWPGAGTLRRVFSTEVDGKRVVDEQAWEAAIQQVLAACKEFKVACGYPASPNDIEMRMKQGFSVFVMNWGDTGTKAIEIGRAAGGR
jgi:4-hydroxy-2-oxoheptanedioate aldolase